MKDHAFIQLVDWNHCWHLRIASPLLAVMIMFSAPVISRQSDISQPIDVRADRSEYDEKAGRQTLSGNVEVTQGTMQILADQISIDLKDNALSRIEGVGSPIRFRQENDAGELMQGQAQRIIYDALNGTLTLLGAATLSQPRQELVSEKIIFDSRSQKVLAQGGEGGGRVSIQIKPPANVSQTDQD